MLDLPTDPLPHVDQDGLWSLGGPEEADRGSRVKLDRMKLSRHGNIQTR